MPPIRISFDADARAGIQNRIAVTADSRAVIRRRIGVTSDSRAEIRNRRSATADARARVQIRLGFSADLRLAIAHGFELRGDVQVFALKPARTLADSRQTLFGSIDQWADVGILVAAGIDRSFATKQKVFNVVLRESHVIATA